MPAATCKWEMAAHAAQWGQSPVHHCEMPQVEDHDLCGGWQCPGAAGEGLDRFAVVIGQGRGVFGAAEQLPGRWPKGAH